MPRRYNERTKEYRSSISHTFELRNLKHSTQIQGAKHPRPYSSYLHLSASDPIGKSVESQMASHGLVQSGSATKGPRGSQHTQWLAIQPQGIAQRQQQGVCDCTQLHLNLAKPPHSMICGNQQQLLAQHITAASHRRPTITIVQRKVSGGTCKLNANCKGSFETNADRPSSQPCLKH